MLKVEKTKKNCDFQDAKKSSKIAEIANILREIAGKLPKIANISKSREISQKSHAIFAKILSPAYPLKSRNWR